jgi:hypothetical protein
VLPVLRVSVPSTPVIVESGADAASETPAALSKRRSKWVALSPRRALWDARLIALAMRTARRAPRPYNFTTRPAVGGSDISTMRSNLTFSCSTLVEAARSKTRPHSMPSEPETKIVEDSLQALP